MSITAVELKNGFSEGGGSPRVGLPGNKTGRLMLLCFAAVFCWGLAAHAYGFFRASFSHDMLNALAVTPVETYWKMQLGRPGIVIYRRLLRGGIAAPWLLGLLSLLWLSLLCSVTVELLRVRNRLFVILTAGLLTVNISVISMTAGYLYEMDANLFAALLGAFAVLLWDRYGWKGCVPGVFLTAFCMGTYQSMLSVPVTLCMLTCVLGLLRGERAAVILKRGLQALAMLALGALVYWLAVRLMCAVKGINLTPDSYNSVSRETELSVLQRIAAVYRTWAEAFWFPSETHIEGPVLVGNILLPLLAVLQTAGLLHRQKLRAAEGMLLLTLLLLLPLGMNTAKLAFSGDAHELMKYAFWLFWLLCLLPFFAERKPTGERIGAACSSADRFDSAPVSGHGTTSPKEPPVALLRTKLPLCCAAAVLLVMLVSLVQTANSVYVKKDLEQQASLSLMTRVLCRLEEQPDYDPESTPLVFVGVSPLLREKLSGFEAYYDINGCEDADPLVKSDATYYYNTYAAYFRYLLNSPASMADTETWTRLQTAPETQAMPCYPAEGCMQVIDGCMVVRMG